ncbi:MAG: hypothetical protein IT429_19470, partial [Gemmataceae bacterium]|nr:hypothetical protein [Gemmataceae bacterium]
PFIDSGIYLIKGGGPIDEPAKLIHRNDGKLSPHLPEGTPFGLIGSSSLYKRESAPGGYVPKGSVTAVAPDPKRLTMNWQQQGGDAGVYANSEIHAIRIVAQEPRTDIRGTGHGGAPLYGNHAMERLRILGEIPVRKFIQGKQPLDSDGNPDTSFLAKIPADQSFTFQTIDRHGMVLNMAQTWHQIRPGEVRNNCGGCHAHSQQPTPFEKTYAARPEYKVFDLTTATPLITAKANDQSGKQWDVKDETGLRHVKGIHNVEYFRDIRPIFERSCVACHSHKLKEPAGGLVLDDDHKGTLPAFGHDAGPSVQVPLTYFRLTVGTERYKPRELGLRHDQASRYLFRFQSRRSLLVWHLFGQRMDGWTNDDFPSLAVRNEPKSLHIGGKPVPKVDYNDEQKLRYWIRDSAIDIDFKGGLMPPPEAVKGTYRGPDGKPVKVAPLTDEDRRTVIRWIDLGCPIDLDPKYDPKSPQPRSYGWMGDDQRPTLTLTYPAAGQGPPLTRILVGMHDAYTGLDPKSFTVTADFPVDGAAPGEDLAARFRPTAPGVWEYRLQRPVAALPHGRLTVSVRDRQGNRNRIERTFSVK